jgi:enoyl-CoA hydratase
MGFENIGFEVNDGIAVLTVDRQGVLNALNRATLEEIDRAVLDVASREDAAALIITGAGSKAFVAGADIRELAECTPEGGAEYSLYGQGILDRIESLGKPVIAAINGFALGGGCELALACHLRVASQSAKLGLPEVSLGIIPGFGGTQRLPRLTGKGKALELILSGEMVGAEEALRIGLVNAIAPDGEVMALAGKLARSIIARGPVAVRRAIEAVNRGLETSQREAMFIESSLFGLTVASEDFKEGTRAFLEKRKPVFKGR